MTKDSKTLRGRFEERFRNTFTDLTEGSEEDFAYTRLTEDVLSFLQSEIALAKKEAYEEAIEEATGELQCIDQGMIGEHLRQYLRHKFLSESPKEV